MRNPTMDQPPADSHISHQTATSYWTSTPATVSGMLGGLPQLSRTDIQGSKNFFVKLRRRRRRRSETSIREQQQGNAGKDVVGGDDKQAGKKEEEEEAMLVERAVDCGAGIGRVTLNFLGDVAGRVDIVEPMKKFTDEITGGDVFAPLRKAGRIGSIFNVGLQDWHPGSETYDLMWHQWCLMQLTDAELVAYLLRARRALRDGGWCVVKENVAGGEHDEFDEADSSVTRNLAKWKAVFNDSGWRIELQEVQRGFPRGLFPVYMWGLRPMAEPSGHDEWS